MRYASSVTSIGWIPSEAIAGMMRLPMDMGMGHYDSPPPDIIDDAAIGDLLDNDRVRFVNRLAAWIDVEDGEIVGAGYSGTGIVGSTTVKMGPFSVTFPGVSFPLLQPAPVIEDGKARFVQTAGGRTGAPLPHRLDHPPYIRVSGPTAWSTLTLEIAADGSATYELTGASPFPRHWVYDDQGGLVKKTALVDWATWTKVHDQSRSPWHGVDHAPLIADVATEAERDASIELMSGKTKIRKLSEGDALTTQGEAGDELYLVLDGVFDVEVDGEPVAEVGPGAIVGERAILEGGVRTSTVRARTAAKVAVQRSAAVAEDTLSDVAAGHRREEG